MRSRAVPKALPHRLGHHRLAVQVADHDQLGYADATKVIADHGWREQHDRDDHRIVFTRHGGHSARRYPLIRTARGWPSRLLTTLALTGAGARQGDDGADPDAQAVR